jgi:hypothetical protein
MCFIVMVHYLMVENVGTFMICNIQVHYIVLLDLAASKGTFK